MIFPAFAAAIVGASREVSRAYRTAARAFRDEMGDLGQNIGSFERPGKFQLGTRVFGGPEVLQCYVTVRRSAATREFKPGPRLAQTLRGSRKI